jgi:dephospho-CoA kinase
MKLQMSEEEKCERADLILDNSGSEEDLRRQVEQAVASLDRNE